MSDVIFSIIGYIVVVLGIISIFWIYQGSKKLTEGGIKTLFRYLFVLSTVCFVYVLWIIILVLFPGLLMEFSSTLISVQLFFSVILFTVITRIALHIKKLGELYGFRE